MTLSDLASIATVISSVAVLGSLIYLALQTRQNTRHTRALIQQGRNGQIVDFNLTGSTDPAWNELLLRGDAGDAALTPMQAIAYMQIVLAQLSHIEDGFYQHREGLIDDERYAGTVAYLRYARAVRPGFRAAWEICKALYGPEFRFFIDAKIHEAASFPAPDTGNQWLDLVAKKRGEPGSAEGATP
ncbi:MAG: hypothetical protein JSR81_13380 [Proteobacteria bacterium]|nr:hypothetical protein [Pseudomonadota bacterium]